jgi:peptidoglycan/LPS O-acetylase OafA/YrhL
MRQTAPTHYPQLDGFRGLAITLILLHHQTVFTPETPIQELWFRLFSGVWYAVDIFFVLSGFLITTMLYRAKGSGNYFRNFYARRFLRIAPLYYLLLAFTFYVLPNFSHPKIQQWSSVSQHQAWYWAFLSNFHVALEGRWTHPVLDVSWTLAIEEQFYLLWPLVVAFFSMKGLKRLCIFGCVFSFLFRALLVSQNANGWLIYVVTPSRMDSILIGALIALYIESSEKIPLRLPVFRYAQWSLLILLELVLVFGTHDQISPLIQTFGYSLVVLTVGVLLLNARLAQPSDLLYKFLASPFMRFMGKYSYGIYFTHLPIRAVIRDYVFPPSSFASFGNPVIGQVLFYVVASIPAIAAGYLTFHLFEKHFLKLKSLFETKEADTAVPYSSDDRSSRSIAPVSTA